MILRPYQEAAVHAVYDHLRTRDDNPCVVIPTGGGKTPVIGTICRDAVQHWGGRVLVLAHVQELLTQAADKLSQVCPELKYGIYSAGLKQRDTDSPVIIAGIQSVFNKACDLGPFNLILIDEAHMLPPDGEGRYRQFLTDARVVNPQVRLVGLTATPFRLKSGMICAPENLLNHISYEIGIKELIVDGYLSPLVTKSGITTCDTSALHVRGGEFVAGEVEQLMDDDERVKSACREIVEYTRDRRATLIFASGVHHGRHICQVLADEYQIDCGFVTGETPTKQRDQLLEQFVNGDLKYLCNVNVLTTGFDAPHIDCVALLRPTMSPGLFYQMVGRGFRLHPHKQNCLVLDFGGNVLRHGPVDQIQVVTRNREPGDRSPPAKLCPECHTLIAVGYGICPECRYEFPPPDRKKHEAEATAAGILSDEISDMEYEVRDVTYAVHIKRNAPPGAPQSMRVTYRLGLDHWQSEFICFEHGGYAQKKAEQWWSERSPDPVPDTAERAVELADAGALAIPEKVTVRNITGEKYDRIIAYQLPPFVAAKEAIPPALFDTDEVPF
ncbi:MAG: DEAD/DEAH box helicase family protein [Proteobacteria bacterium]|nr:DEAD/DEAH box helicase family protein [Pseudomonadota bacterium]MDA1307245.1 DEAD/DEAH box helicase family protein [Acidobacteriota bacterium]